MLIGTAAAPPHGARIPSGVSLVHPAAAPRQSRGFTVVELITTVVILGIVAAIAAPRFFTTSSFETAGFAAEVRAGLRHAQATALASGCSIRASLGSGGFVLQRWSGGSDCNDRSGSLVTVARAGGGTYSASVPSGLAVSTSALYFDSMGRPRDASTGTLLASAQSLTVGTETITVNAETGFVQ